MSAPIEEMKGPNGSAARSAGLIPLWVKLLYTAFVAVLIPYYWHSYGPTNFLYYCDMALLLTLVALWLESSLLVSMCAVGILMPQTLWIADFLCEAAGFHLTGMNTSRCLEERRS